MRIEDLVYFQTLNFDNNGQLVFAYSYAGSDQQHFRECSNRGGYYETGRRITPVGSPDVWQEAIAEKELEMPKINSGCPRGSQVFLWRAFTETSLTEFKKNMGRGESVLDQNGKTGIKRVHKKVTDLEKPGYLWFARDPELALGVGVARSVLTSEAIYLLGINVDRDNVKGGYNIWEVLRDADNSTLYLVSPEDIARHRPFSLGEIVDNVPQEKIIEGVSYRVDLEFFTYIRNALYGANPTTKNINEIACFLHPILRDISDADPAIETFLQGKPMRVINTLPRTWGMFLNRIPNSTFLPDAVAA